MNEIIFESTRLGMNIETLVGELKEVSSAA
jgi:hypothetical protein